MNVLMLNQTWFKLEGVSFSNFAYHHASMTRNILLAHHIASQENIKVYFQTADETEPTHPFNFIWWDKKQQDFDVVVTIQSAPLLQNPRWQSHPFIVMYGDTNPLDSVKLFLVDSPILLREYKIKQPSMDIRQGCWGVTDWPLVANPYTNKNKPIAIFSGHVYLQETLDTLNRLAEEDAFELWAVIEPDKSILKSEENRGFTDTERALMLSPNIHLVSDVVGQIKGHGPVVHGTFTGFLQHADVGLCLGQGLTTGKTSTFCKVYDYIGNGLPLIADARIPDVENILKVQGGSLYDFFNYNSLVDTIKKEITIKHNRQKMKEQALQLWGWEAQARQFKRLIAEKKYG